MAGFVDDLMIIQYREDKLSTVYSGPIEPAAKAARYYDHSLPKIGEGQR
jgi:hypothetical protein